MIKSIYLLLIIALLIATIYLLYRNSIVQIQNSRLVDANLRLIGETVSVKKQFGFSVAKSNCWTCHKFKNATDNLLEGVVQRIGPDYLKLYITKQDSLVSAKDAYAMKLKNAFNNMGNSHNFKLNDEELSALIEFMK